MFYYVWFIFFLLEKKQHKKKCKETEIKSKEKIEILLEYIR